MSTRAISLHQFILRQERLHPEATGEFTNLLTDIALAAKINDPANGINGMAYDVHGWPDSWLFEAAISQSGGHLLTEDGQDIAFDGPAGLNALKTFRRFVTEGGMQLIDWEQSRQQFGAGKVGIIFSTPAHLTQVTGLVGTRFELKTSTFPMDDAAKGNIPTGGNAVVMLTQDAAKQNVGRCNHAIIFPSSPRRRRFSHSATPSKLIVIATSSPTPGIILVIPNSLRSNFVSQRKPECFLLSIGLMPTFSNRSGSNASRLTPCIVRSPLT